MQTLTVTMGTFCVALLLSLLALESVKAQSTTDGLSFRHMTMPPANLTQAEINALVKSLVKPKIDFKPTGKISPPASAGQSYLKTKTQIIGGAPAALQQFPWQIYLNVDSAWLCGGSIIAANWVLTAAHCVDGGSIFVVTVGGIDRTTDETYEKSQVSNVGIKHEKYDRRKIINDVAVISLPEPFQLNQYINVIRLPRQSDASNTFAGKAVTASGYGMPANKGPASPIMNFVSLVIATNAACASYYGKSIISSIICTAADPTKSICSGDSGGPLMYLETDGKFTQIGVVSFGSSASCTGYPAGFSRVTSFLGWISQKTGIKILP